MKGTPSSVVLKGFFYVGASLCRLCVSNVFDARPIFDMDDSHVFPQGFLDIITMMGVWLVLGDACAGCEAGLPLCSVAVTTLSGLGLLPSCWNRSPEGQAQSGSIPLKFMLCPKGGDC